MIDRAPATPSSKVRRTPSSTPGASHREEKIFVTVRLRPLSRREQALYDLIAWECTDDNTIIYKNPNQERGAASYVFDRVFGPASSTYMVYEEGAKDVALSALKGINSTIFAYGQTSSGKTYTMRGITENAIKDIYEHIKENPERDFVLKVSALEIYNESVNDLLNHDSGPLRLLDDPEKGTVVEKLVEVVVKDSQHLQHLIGLCEAQRQIGETALNDKSSRSHQIIRLTIESALRENSECVKSFIASLNLVDLAGSERACQTNAGGARLKEGSHINRSLLTLTNVIRKLRGTSSGVIPGSKLGLREGLTGRDGPEEEEEEEEEEDDLEPLVRMRRQEHLDNLPDQVAQLNKEETPDRDQHQHHRTGTALLEHLG
ncbi:kinesin-like protein KIN-7A [Eucalyptus grandis]|uniref:kinesin-like protein KIN-7A n=1 Tax=Eucalyptus grandis TaxID=71139 RepID=UPI00192EC5A3|nr:kinesin-like protein KIN-7A [Eucalyptus grandis]